MDQAIVLAAGEGQRLKPLTGFRPKVMLPIGNKPILQYVLEAVVDNGIRNVIIVTGYRKEQVQDYFGSGKSLGIRIEYVEQKQQIGTAHALKQAWQLAGDLFMVLSADNIINAATIAPLMDMKSHALLVKQQKDASKYGVVTMSQGRITSIVEKPGNESDSLVSLGIYAFTHDIFDFIGDEVDLPNVLTGLIERGVPIAACRTSGVWLDAVYPWDVLKLNALVLANAKGETAGHIEHGVSMSGPVRIDKGSIIRSGCYIVGPVDIGKNCEVGPNSCLFPSTSIGDGTVVSAFCCIKNSVIANDIQIGPSSYLEDSVIAAGTRLGAHFAAHSMEVVVQAEGEQHPATMGTVVGEHCYFEPGVVVRSGVLVGNHCRVDGLKLLQRNVPDGALVV
ncbi:MAG: NTP transferase domain-containing protein [Chloroflexi bacterium]|nr:NTP transferase domain-containing protein [Chloroflexota bacterium]